MSGGMKNSLCKCTLTHCTLSSLRNPKQELPFLILNMKTSNSTLYVVLHLCLAIRSFSNGHYHHTPSFQWSASADHRTDGLPKQSAISTESYTNKREMNGIFMKLKIKMERDSDQLSKKSLTTAGMPGMESINFFAS